MYASMLIGAAVLAMWLELDPGPSHLLLAPFATAVLVGMENLPPSRSCWT